MVVVGEIVRTQPCTLAKGLVGLRRMHAAGGCVCPDLEFIKCAA